MTSMTSVIQPEHIRTLLTSLFEQPEFAIVLPPDYSLDDKVKLLPSESMLSLYFIVALEEEYNIEFEDDEIDVTFFHSIDHITAMINNHLYQQKI